MLRGVPWPSVGGAVLAGGVLLVLAVASAGSAQGETFLAFGFALLAAATAFVLDEPAAAAVDAAPRTLGVRSGVRLAAAAVPLGVGASAVPLMLRHAALPASGLLLELVGCLLLSIAGAAILRRAQPTPGDLVASLVGVGVIGLALVEPFARWVTLFHWSASGEGRASLVWGALCTGCIASVLWATRDLLHRG